MLKCISDRKEDCMGCIIEFFLELIVEGVAYTYGELMLLIVPKGMISKKTESVLRTVICLFSVLLFILIIVGLVLMDMGITPLGNYLAYIPFAIIVVQIICGIIVRNVNKNKDKK